MVLLTTEVILTGFLPIGNIVTDINTWKEITNILGFCPRTVPEIIDYFFREFGPLALEKLVRMNMLDGTWTKE